MNNSKLVKILRTFSKHEMKEFEKFISSPFFNGGRNYIPFFNQLKKFYPEFDSEKLTPEYIYSQMYPGKEFNKQIIWNMTSSMVNLAEEFLMLVSLKKNKYIRDYHTAEEFWERKLTSYYYKKLTDMESTLDKMGLDDNYFRYKTQLEKGKISYYFLEDTQHLVYDHIVKEGDFTILAFMRDISDVIGSLYTSSSNFNTKFDENLSYTFIRNLDMEKIVAYSNECKFKYAWAIEMYYKLIMMEFEPDNTEHFFRLQKLFEQNFDVFQYGEKYTWTTVLSNYCITQVNLGSEYFRQIAFELDKFRLKEGLLYQGKYMSKILFVRIVGNAANLNEIDWGKRFIEEYIHTLNPAYQKPMKALSYATIYFMMKEYNHVIENLSKVKFNDILDKLYVRNFYLRTYYELGETEILLNYIDSTRHFLNKNESLGREIRDNYVRFINYLNKMALLRNSRDDFEVNKLAKAIQEDMSSPSIEWLLKKVNEIMKST